MRIFLDGQELGALAFNWNLHLTREGQTIRVGSVEKDGEHIPIGRAVAEFEMLATSSKPGLKRATRPTPDP